MTKYIRIDWADVRPCDVLMHENGDRLTVKAVAHGPCRDMYVLGQWRNAVSLTHAGFTPHRKKPELPTKPGAYLDKDGNYWLLTHAGDWYDWSTQQQPKFFYDDPSTHAPFTRLVPMPTEEQVYEAIDKVMPDCFFGELPHAADAVMALLGGEIR